jgi:hypothetical protein
VAPNKKVGVLVGELRELIEQVESGAVDAADVAPRIAEICSLHRRGRSTMREISERMAGARDEDDPTDSFLEVTAAWTIGRLSDDQYAVLKSAVVGDTGRPTADDA